jgi:superfamily I DNA/RNA helicase
LIHRVAYLLMERGVPPEQILVLTFTRAASRELKERLTQYLHVLETELPLVCTLHSFALRTLLKYQAQSDIIRPLSVADDYEEKHILLPEIGQIIKQPPSEVGKAIEAFQATWNTLNQDHEEWSAVDFRRDLEKALKYLSEFYGFTLRGELIFRLLNLMDGNPLIVQRLGIHHILVDEYQDLNYCDQQVIARMEEFGANLFVVGDDDQSIYHFRHAYPDGIREFVKLRMNCGDYQLNTCHRCPTSVVNLATSLIGWDQTRVDRELRPEPSAIPGDVYALQFQGYADEADSIAAICKAYVEANLLQPQDIAILLSRRSLAERIIKGLSEVNLPTVALVPIWPLGGREDPQQHEGRLIYCILRLLVNQQDTLATRTWMELQRGISLGTIKNLREFCDKQNLSFWDGLMAISKEPGKIQRGKIVKRHFDDLLTALKELRSIENLEDVLNEVVGPSTGNLSVEKGQVREFLDHLIEKEQIENLSDLVQTLQTSDVKAETQLEADAVRVMTMHKAKGLSSELIIIPALEQSLMPGQFDDDLARRMMYVAMTRSRHILILTHALTRTGAQSHLGAGRGQWNRRRSHFMDEMEVKSQTGKKFVKELNQRLSSAPTLSGGVRIRILQELIKEAFSGEDLELFCYNHFQEVYKQFGTGMSKTVKIQRLIEYCEQGTKTETLIARIKDYNPSQFERFAEQLRMQTGEKDINHEQGKEPKPLLAPRYEWTLARFKLQLSRLVKSEFEVRAFETPMGEPHVQTRLPYNQDDLIAILKALPAASLAAAKLTSAQVDALRDLGLLTKHGLVPDLHAQVGQALYQSLFPGDVGTAFKLTLTQVRPQRRRVSLQLRFDEEAVALARYPWELTHDNRRHLLPSGTVELTRYISYPEATTTLSVEPPLRVLYIESRPTDLRSLSKGKEQTTVRAALEALAEDGLLVLETLSPPTYNTLIERIERNQDHVLHFDGHGTVARCCPACGAMNYPHYTVCQQSGCNRSLTDVPPLGYLAFEKEHSHDVDWVNSKALEHLLYPSQVRVAILSACRSGEVRGETLFGGVGPALIQAGVPAVVAMQVPITVPAAAEFMQGLYGALAHFASLPAAMTSGRRRLFRSREWFIPALYLRSNDDEGRLFVKQS